MFSAHMHMKIRSKDYFVNFPKAFEPQETHDVGNFPGNS